MGPTTTTTRTIGGEKTVKTVQMPVGRNGYQERSLYGHSSYGTPQAFVERKIPISPGNINLVGVVFHDPRHAHLKKVLHDDTYWNSLDSETKLGPAWDVHILGMADPAQRPDFQTIKSHIRSSLDEYGIKRDEDQLPFFVFLCPSRTPSGFLHFCVPLSDKSLTDAFDSLRNVIQTATNAVKRVEKQNYDKAEVVFELVQSEFVIKNYTKFLTKIPSCLEKLKSTFMS